MSHERFSRVLEGLEVPRGGRLYVQSSTDWLGKAGFDPADVLAVLRDWVGSAGTLIMPSYPTRVPHREYLSTTPTYDVRTTPAGIGLIPEVFRRGANVRRSLDPDFSIAAEGADADEVVRTDLSESDPFGRASTYERLLSAPATMIGVGVSLNTHSFIHVIDSRLQDSYPRPVYAGDFAATVIDAAGHAHKITRRALAPEFQTLTRPSAVAAALAGEREVFRSQSMAGAMFFKWDLPRWSAWCQAHGDARIKAGQWPCWLEQLGKA